MAELRKTSSKALVACLQAVAHIGGTASVKQICDWTGFGATTVRHAVRILEHCGPVTVEGGRVNAAETLPHPLSVDAGINVVANALSQTDSFVELAALLNAGHTPSEAARRASMVESTLTDADSAATLLAVAVDLGLLKDSGDGTYAVAETIETQAVQYVAANMAAGAAQLALRETMGTSAFASLERTERSRLGQAMQNINVNPERACEDAGKAAENYLRLVAANAGVDVSGCNGLGQVADTLAGKIVAVIRPQHRATAQQVAMARNASGHERDKHTLDRWEKTPAFARATVLLSARLIASVHSWLHEGRQTL